MEDPISVDRLVRLGLTQYEARAYVALVRRDASTAAEVARLAGVPRPRIYDVLQSLVTKGLAADRPGRTVKFVAIPPDRAIEQLIMTHRGRLAALEDDARGVIDDLRSAFQEGQRHTDPMDYIEVIRSPDAVATRFNDLQQSVESEMLVFSKAPATIRIEDNVVGLELARRHVLRSVYEMSLLDDAAQLAGMREFLAAGEQARFVEELPMKLGIIDERTVLFTMPDPIARGDDLTTVVIEHPHLAHTLKIGFESVWASGITFAQACRRLGIKTPRTKAS